MNPHFDVVYLAAVLVAAAVVRWRRPRKRDPTHPWSLSSTLLWLTPNDRLTIGDACRGVLVTGSTGSGKTSGPGDAITLSLMRAGCGLLMLTAKTSDLDRIKRLAASAGRSDDVLIFGPGSDLRYDAIGWAMQARPGATSDDAAKLLDNLMRMMSRTTGGNGGDHAFFELAAGKAIRSGLTLMQMAYGTANLPMLYTLIVTAPTSAEEFRAYKPPKPGEEDRRPLVIRALEKAKDANPHDLELARAYWEGEWAVLGDRTRGAVLATVTNTLSPFLPSFVNDLMSAGADANVCPQDVIDGKILVIDMPYLVWKDTGRLIQAMFKIQTQWEVLRRPVTPNMRPVAVIADEAHFHALPEHDVAVQTVSRESNLINVAIVQSLPVLSTVFSGNDKQVYSWIANLACKFICSNSCNDTNEFYSKLFGNTRKLFYGGGGQQDFDLFDEMMGKSKGAHVHFNEQWQAAVPPHLLAELKTGGPENNLWVECYFHLAGRIFSNGKAYIKTLWKQG